MGGGGGSKFFIPTLFDSYRELLLNVKAYIQHFGRVHIRAVYQLDSTKQLKEQSVLPNKDTVTSANALDINLHWRLKGQDLFIKLNVEL